MIYCLIPAAGKSTRMGRPKLLLPLGGRSVLEIVIAAVRRAAVGPILVVVGPHAPQLGPLAEAAGARVLTLTEESSGMRVTIEQGLRWLEDHFHPRMTDRVLLVLADYPTLDAGVIRRLVQARKSTEEHSIVMPTYQGRRGHPVLFDWGHVASIRAFPPDSGINVYLREKRRETLELPMDSEEILRDMDTPEDYKQLRRRWQE
jgi:molybdenum cofactor cytidylyltransferase